MLFLPSGDGWVRDGNRSKFDTATWENKLLARLPAVYETPTKLEAKFESIRIVVRLTRGPELGCSGVVCDNLPRRRENKQFHRNTDNDSNPKSRTKMKPG